MEHDFFSPVTLTPLSFLQADDGFLYPLERAFFYVQKPPMLLVFDDIDSLEFMRQAAGATSAKTFDLAVRMRSGSDYLFRGIPRCGANRPPGRGRMVERMGGCGHLCCVAWLVGGCAGASASGIIGRRRCVQLPG